MMRGFILSPPANFDLYRPTAFGPRSRQRFFGDRRARWSAHFGGDPSDVQWMTIDAVIGVEWDIRRLEAKRGKDRHELGALVNLRRQYRQMLNELGVKMGPAKPSGPTLHEFVAAYDRAKAESAA